MTIISLTRLARRLDTTIPRIQNKTDEGKIQPVAYTVDGVPMFDLAKVEEYRRALLISDVTGEELDPCLIRPMPKSKRRMVKAAPTVSISAPVEIQ